jgi:hypothetical protein
MRHEPPIAFHATPQRSTRSSTEADLARRLTDELRPSERAREDAQRLNDDPHAHAIHFCQRAELSRHREHGIVRAEAIATITQEMDQAGALVAVVDPLEARHVVEQASVGADRVQIDRRRNALSAIEKNQAANSAYAAWCDVSGAKRRHTPWPELPKTMLYLGLSGLLEWAVLTLLLTGAAVAGVLPGYVLAAIFAGMSVCVGVAGGTAASLAADKRGARKSIGWVCLTLVALFWLFMSFCAAHLRAVIEAGGAGSATEILASMHRGPLDPLISPVCLIVIGSSALAAVAAWIKWVDYIGAPIRHRHHDMQRLWTEEAVHWVEEDHRGAVRAVFTAAVAELVQLELKAWEAPNNGHRLEREIGLIRVRARQSTSAIERAIGAIVTDYAATTRRLRAGVDVSADVALAAIPDEPLGDPEALHGPIAALTETATMVSKAVADAKASLARLDVTHLREVDRLYGVVRPTHVDPNTFGRQLDHHREAGG